MVRRILLLIIGLGTAAAGAWAGQSWWTAWRFVESTDDAYVQADTTLLSAKVPGHVVEVGAWDDQPVTKGQVLVRLDDRDYRARVGQAAAGVAARRAAIAHLDAQYTVQQAAIAAADAQVAVAAATLTLARQELDRATRLQREDIASRQRLQTTQADLARAEAGLRAAQANALAVQGRLAVLDGEREMAVAALQQAEAQRAAADLDLEATVVRAPIDGVVGNRVAQVGQYARPGAHLMAVVPLRHVYVEANFKETQIHRLRPGQTVDLAIDAFPGQRLTGRVASFSPASGAEFSLLPPENATGNFTKVVQRIPVRIAVPSDTPLLGQLRPGMSVVATIDTRTGTGGPLSAQAAER